MTTKEKLPNAENTHYLLTGADLTHENQQSAQPCPHINYYTCVVCAHMCVSA